MIIFWIVLGLMIALAALLIIQGGRLAQAAAQRGVRESDLPGSGLVGTGLSMIGVVVLLGVIGGVMAAWPNYQLWSAKIERERIVVQARQEAEAAVEQARGEVARARGVAEANEIVAQSLTPEYLRYHYINTLAENNQNVIYIPTEAGLPILEAGGQFAQRTGTEE